ncbi:DUF3656 domain-containing protein [Atopobiaceae bacterium 24-176]
MEKRFLELLAPAGTRDAFWAALAGGADAVYCGLGNDFNARRGADNFDDETFAACCRAAHVAGAQVFVTFNVVIQDDEMPRALASVARAVRLGADALIVQDWGLAAEAKRCWPEVEVHVSTQANVHDPRGVAWCGERGFERVTLSRELPLAEVAACCATGVECEVFGHGALCFCYSGLCQMSSLRGPRSANRGLCAQPCRLPHTLEDASGKRLGPVAWERGLCPKDALSLDHLAELMDAGAGSLKVEGRMKAPEYVLSVVSAYREAIDSVEKGRSADAAGGLYRQLKRAFNRDFTDAYLMGRSDNDMMSYERSNNRGETVGSVAACSASEATVALDAPVGKGDLLEFRPVDAPDTFFCVTAPAEGEAGARYRCPVRRRVPVGAPVRVLRSQAALDAVSSVEGRTWPRRRPVDVTVRCVLGEPLRVRLSCLDSGACAEATGPVVDAARTKELAEQDVVAHVGRMGETPFEAVSMDVELSPGCGMGFSVLHRVRAEAADALVAAIEAPYEKRAATAAVPPAWEAWGAQCAERRAQRVGEAQRAVPRDAKDREGALRQAARRAEVCCLAPSPEVARAAFEAGAQRVYVPGDELLARPGDFPAGCVPVLDEVCREPDHGRIDPLVAAGAPVAVGNVSELALAAERGAAPEIRGCIPVHNRSCVEALEEAGAVAFWLSPELTVAQMVPVCRAASVPVGVTVYGAVRAMTSEHCVLQMADACIHDCDRCRLRERDLYLRNIDDRRLPVRTDRQGRSRIWWDEPLDATPKARELLLAGVTRLMVDATLLDADRAARQVRRVAGALEAVAKGRALPAPEPGSTLGHLFSKVD